MIIDFQGLIPFPLKETNIEASEVWERDISFNSGNTYLVSAESGKGKTTLLHCIYGLRKDYEGEVLIDSEPISALSQNELLKLRKNNISIVPQGLFLFDELSYYENIKLKNRLTNFKTENEIEEMSAKLGMQKFYKQKAKTLSYGQKQRTAIVRALCQSFDFILLDEPFSHLDEKNVELGWNLIKEEAAKQNAGIILTSLGNTYNINFDNTLIL
jgi:ABC-type lipoprotein export system ATPase subunit